MPRRLHNWSYNDVTDFLRRNGFVFYKELKGSHEKWIKHGTEEIPNKIVEVNFRHDTYPVKTLQKIIQQSGIACGMNGLSGLEEKTDEMISAWLILDEYLAILAAQNLSDQEIFAEHLEIHLRELKAEMALETKAHSIRHPYNNRPNNVNIT